MNIFLVLLKKEIKELLTAQLVITIAVTLLVFHVIGKAVGSHNKSSAARNGIVVLDLDRSDLSARLLKAISGAKTRPSAAPQREIAAAMAAPEYAAENSFMVIPAGLQAAVTAGKSSNIEYYSRFRREASGLGPAIAASQIRRTQQAAAKEVSAYLMQLRLPGLAPDFLRDPAPPREFAVVNGRTAEVSLAQVIGFIQSQSYFFPIAVFFIVILSAQMIMTAVASEKENKTLETLLSSPLDRRLLVMSKLAAATLIAAALSGAYMLGMRSFMAGVTGLGADPAVAVAAAGPALTALGVMISGPGYLLVGLSVMFCILCALSIAFILGILSEDVKSIQTMMTPLMMPLMLAYLLPIFIDMSTAHFGLKLLLYAIPFTHAFMAPQNVMMGNIPQVWWGILYQAAVFAVCVNISTRLFSGDALLTLRLRLPWQK
ncbi:MAG: ABC transporter permease [Elusimicrobiales bacterium]